MAIAFNAITSADSSVSATTLSVNHTAAGSNRLAVVIDTATDTAVDGQDAG